MVRPRERNIKAQLRQLKENERLRGALDLLCCALVALVPFYLLVRASLAWTPHPRFFPDDALYARICFPAGFVAYWHDFGLYRLLALPAYALSNRALMRATLSPFPFTFIVLLIATVVLLRACAAAGLSRSRAALMAAILLGSPLLLETLNFWSGTCNYALVLLLVALQLRASLWARKAARPSSSGYAATACGALLALLTYEIALPFTLATSAFYARRGRRLLMLGVACALLLVVVGALILAGLYWPLRFKLMAEQLTALTTGGGAPVVNPPEAMPVAAAAAPPPGAPARLQMYASLSFSFIRTGLLSSWFWIVLSALAGLSLLARSSPSVKAGEDGRRAENAERLPENLVAGAFVFALGACVVYLLVTKSMNARYVAFLLIYAAATLVWTKHRAAPVALALLVLVQTAVAAALPVHMRDLESASKGQAASAAPSVERADVISINGRLVRASWGKRFVERQAVDMLRQPLSQRVCRYAEPCEKCD